MASLSKSSSGIGDDENCEAADARIEAAMGLATQMGGSDDEEVTDAEAHAVLGEIFGGASLGAAEEDKRRALLSSTTKSLEKASRTVKFAVAHDRGGEAEKAIEAYDEALKLYAEALGDDVLKAKPAEAICAQRESYMQRSLELRVGCLEAFSAPPVAQSRKGALQALSKRGVSVLKRGVALYRRAKEPPGADWPTYVLFSESLECLLVYLKGPGEKNAMVTKCVTEMLDKTEAIKASHVSI